MYTILICDDDRDIVSALEIYLSSEGYRTISACNGEEAIAAVEQQGADLVLMDVMMPKLDGIRATAKLRERGNIPIILLTAKGEDADKVLGLNIGADDYITKPFAIEELLARIRAALRNKAEGAADTPAQVGKLTAGPLTMDVERHEVEVDGQSVELTRREFDLLRYLLEHKGKVVSREALLDHVWGFDFVGETNTVDVYIRFLRTKIDERFSIKLIHTVRGVGYAIREE